MSQSNELLDLAVKVAGWAKPGEEVEAYVGRSNSTTVRVYDSDIESLSAAQEEGVGIRVIVDGRQGFAYAGSLEASVIEDTLAEARDNAGFAERDEFNALATPDGVTAPDMDLYRESLLSVPTEKKVELAFELERKLRAADQRIRTVPMAAYADGADEVAIATSTGIAVWGHDTSCVLQTYCLAADGEETQTGFGFTVGRQLDDLELDKAVADAAHRATRLLGSTKPKSRRLPIILDPFVTASFLGVIGFPLTGEAVAKGRSFFADRIGESVASPNVTLLSDPTDTRSLAANPVDGEGLASRRVPLITDGVLTGFVHNSYTGRRSGAASTGSAVRGIKSTPTVACRAIALKEGTKSQEQLIAELGEGLLVQSVSGLHSGVNPVSGDFSTGAEGLMFRDGQLAEPVREITIGSTLQRMLSDVVDVGGDIEVLPMGVSMSVAIADVSMSGI